MRGSYFQGSGGAKEVFFLRCAIFTTLIGCGVIPEMVKSLTVCVNFTALVGFQVEYLLSEM